MPPRVKDRDLGWKRIKKDIKNLDSFVTKVGFPADGELGAVSIGGKGEEVMFMSDMVMVAAANEFGTKRIPPRPFLRTATDENKHRIKQLQEKLYWDVISVRRSPKEALAILGEFLTGKVRNKIVSIKTPPNAPSTLAGKFPKTNPLIDKGQMVQSVQHEESFEKFSRSKNVSISTTIR